VRLRACSALALALASPAFAQTSPAFAQTADAPADAPGAASTERFNIDAFDVTGNSILSSAEVERAVYPHLGPARSPDDVEAARAALEKAYHAKGYTSVFVDLAQEPVAQGILALYVTESKIGSVTVTGAKHASAEDVLARVPSLRSGGVPDLTATEREIMLSNEMIRSRQITPLLKPGKEPGTVDVELKVQDKLPVTASLTLSNDHNNNTKPLRLNATVGLNNLWGAGHTVSGTYLVAPERRSDLEVFSGSYMAPLWGTPWSLLAYGYKSNSNVAALGGTNVLGDGYAIGLRAILKLPSKNSAFSHSVNFGFDYKDFNEDIFFGGIAADAAPIHYVPFTTAYSAYLFGEKSSLGVTLSGTFGMRVFNDIDCRPGSAGTCQLEDQFVIKRAAARENFIHLNLDIDYSREIGRDWVAALKLSGQYADSALVSNEQFAAGGMSSVRGYLQSEAVGDDGVAASLEVRTPSLTIGEMVDEWRFFAFTDYGYARLREALPDQKNEFQLWSMGLGTRIRMLDMLTGEVVVGVPYTGDTARGRKPLVSFSVKAEY